MNFAEANEDPESSPDVEAEPQPPAYPSSRAAHPEGDQGSPETNGWGSEELAPTAEAPVFRPARPRLIPNLGHTLVFGLLLVPSFIAGYILTFLFFLAVLHPANAHLLIERMGREFRYAITMQAVVYGVQWALAALVFGLWWGRSLTEGVHWNAATARRWIWRLALIGVATGLVMTLAGNFVPMPKTPPILEDLTKSRLGAWLMLIFGVTLAPLTEELAFRGFLLMSLINFFRWLERRGAIGGAAVRNFGIPVSIVITSFAFAMVHAGQVSHSWGPLLLIGMVSVILCIVRLRLDSVAAGVVVHAAYNLTLFAALLVQTDAFRHLDKLNG